MTKYEQIKQANDTIRTVDVKGKDYAEVNQRIKAFRMVCPDGSIETEMISNENGVCVFKAIVKNEEGKVLGVGHAYEKEGSTFINKTSYIENCETSAVGRALGMCGYGIDTSVASAEEVKNAIANQEEKAPINGVMPSILPAQLEIINGLDEKMRSFACKKFNVAKLEDLNSEQAQYIIDSLRKKGIIK